MDLLNQAPLHLPHTNCRKASYIHIARDDLQRRDLFKPAQYLRSHLDQLPLLRLPTQATSYIPSHLHLANDHTYTPNDQRYCSSCLPIYLVGTKLYTLLHCSHSFPLSHPVILNLTRALHRYVSSAPGPHTPHSNKLLFSLGPTHLNSSANTTKHGLTLPSLHAHNSSTQSNLTFPNNNPQPLPGPYRPSSSPLPAPPLMIHNARCVKVPLTRKKCFSVTYVTPVGIWTASSPPSPPSLQGYGNVPCAPLLTPHSRVHCDTSATLSYPRP